MSIKVVTDVTGVVYPILPLSAHYAPTYHYQLYFFFLSLGVNVAKNTFILFLGNVTLSHVMLKTTTENVGRELHVGLGPQRL